MPTERLVIVGAGGHGRVVMDALLAGGGDAEIGFVDDDPALHGQVALGRAIGSPATACLEPGFRFHVAIGGNAARQSVIERLIAAGGRIFTVLHPRANVSRFCDVEAGAFVAAGATVGPGARVAAGAIVNHGAVVDHDCQVGPCAHVAPNATLGGHVRLGRNVLVGAGANLLPGVEVGDDAVIGAGAVVLAGVPAGTVWGGVPARRLERTSD